MSETMRFFRAHKATGLGLPLHRRMFPNPVAVRHPFYGRLGLHLDSQDFYKAVALNKTVIEAIPVIVHVPIGAVRFTADFTEQQVWESFFTGQCRT